jgi:secreted trypsin-like serine protease
MDQTRSQVECCALVLTMQEKIPAKKTPGGPLVVDNILAGIASWGIGCSREGDPGVYSNVPALRDHIKKKKNMGI